MRLQELPVHLVKIRSLGHGRARNVLAKHARGEFLVFFSQDVLPKGQWMKYLLKPLRQKSVAGSFGRQLAFADAPLLEKFFYKDQFPSRQRKKKAYTSVQKYFFSNAFSAIKKSVWESHPFDERVLMSEDQEWSMRVQQAGFSIRYAPRAQALHSHYYSFRSLFQRYFDSLVSLTQIFSDRFNVYALHAISYLLREYWYVLRKKPWLLPYWLVYVFVRSSGAILGRYHGLLPRWLCRKISKYSFFWD
jgi:rhamnosyltransferase